MTKKILIPLDGSATGEVALRYVEKLITDLGAEKSVEIILLQIIKNISHSITASETSVDVPFSETEIEQVKKGAIDYLFQAGHNLKRKGVKIACEVMISNEDVSCAEEIIKAEETFNADLIAISTHGRRGLKRWAFGSVTDKVLNAGQIPVIVVRAEKFV